MSEKTNHNQKLKDLLKKHSEQTGRDADEFEREALEGFAMLNNEADAMDLKKSLDKKIYSEVFAEKKQESRRFYWLAAAALIGVIGMSIYLFQTYLAEKKTELAIQAPKTVPMLENAVPEASTASQQNSPLPKTTAEVKTIKQVQENNNQETTDIENEGQKLMEDLNDASYTAPAPVPANEASEREQTVKALPMSDQPNATTASEPSRSSTNLSETKEEIAGKKNKSVEKQDGLKKTSDENIVVVSAGTKSFPTCSFKGGDKELQKQLWDQLKQKNLLYPFDASLFLNKKGKIEKVLIKNADGLSAEDREKIIELIKQLNDFKVSGLKGSEQIEYRIEFRP